MTRESTSVKNVSGRKETILQGEDKNCQKESNFGVCEGIEFYHKLKFPSPYIYGTWCCRLLIFQTKIIWCKRIHSLKYLRSTTLGCRDIGIYRKSEFVTKTQFLSCNIRNVYSASNLSHKNFCFINSLSVVYSNQTWYLVNIMISCQISCINLKFTLLINYL